VNQVPLKAGAGELNITTDGNVQEIASESGDPIRKVSTAGLETSFSL